MSLFCIILREKSIFPYGQGRLYVIDIKKPISVWLDSAKTTKKTVLLCNQHFINSNKSFSLSLWIWNEPAKDIACNENSQIESALHSNGLLSIGKLDRYESIPDDKHLDLFAFQMRM